MPGVVISTAVRTGPSVPLINQTSQAFFVGLTRRGPSDGAVLVRSLEEFEDIFGGYASWSLLHPTVEMFFEEGGTQCYIVRTVGDDATVGSLDLDDAGADSSIVLTANGPGDWSTSVSAQVVAGTVSGTFGVRIFLDTKPIFFTGNCTSRDQAIGKINLNAEAAKYVKATAGVSDDAPATMGSAASLSAGDDDRAAVVDASYIAGLELFNDALGTGAVACPETSTATMAAALLFHANQYSRVAILHGSSSATVAQIKTFAQDFIANNENLEHGALYYPWVYAPTAVNGVNRLLPPDGYVAAKRAKVINSGGPHLPAAGVNSEAVFVNGVVTDIDRTNGDALDDESINAIRVINNTVRVYGARSLSQDTTNFRYITAQDTINGIVVDSYRALEPLVFSPIDGRGGIFASVEARLISVLEGYRISGALYEAFDANGRRVDYGYTVKCDGTLNPASQLVDGKVKAKVGVRVSSVGDKLEVEIVKSSLTTSVT